jgi:hypothetical protein
VEVAAIVNIHNVLNGEIKMQQQTQRVVKKVNIAVSSPELVQARKVRLVITPTKSNATKRMRYLRIFLFQLIRNIIIKPTTNVRKEKMSDK